MSTGIAALAVGDLVCVDMRRKDGAVRKATKRTKGHVVGHVKAVHESGHVVVSDGRSQFLMPVSR